jgi:putative transposase
MVRDTRRDSVYLFGAICPQRAVGAAVILPAVNIEGMNLHLEEISSQVAPGAVAAVICDGAGWLPRVVSWRSRTTSYWSRCRRIHLS